MDKKIMIVDDEPDILTSLKAVFEYQDYDVITVKSGKECLREVEKGFKGIILMDIMMPGMDGWDTIRELIDRKLINGVSIDIITAKGTSDHEKMKGLESFIDDYFTKPIDIKKLISSIKKCSMSYHTELDN